MQRITFRVWLAAIGLPLCGSPSWADTPVLEEVSVIAARVANQHPSASASTIATALRFDPETDIQARGAAESQADILIRGGTFENTAVTVGAMTIMDPQTGHYALELPIDPDLLSRPSIRVGSAHGSASMNATAGSVQYALLPIEAFSTLTLGVGENAMSLQSLGIARTRALTATDSMAIALAAARSSSDGTVTNGDHDMERYNLAVQHRSDSHQSDLLLAYQDKFFGWPGAYTGFATLAETDHTKTSLVLANHRAVNGATNYQVSAYARELVNDYDFDRSTVERGGPGAFDHVTRVWGIGGQLATNLSGNRIEYTGQWHSDELVSSTDLTEGDFTSRDYLSLSVAPVWLAAIGREQVTFKTGLSYADTNRDSSQLGPLVSVLWAASDRPLTLGIDYTQTSQVPGYTALRSRPNGLFGGNSDLGREVSQQLNLDLAYQAERAKLEVAAYLRNDRDLVDWTYSILRTTKRQANPVDLDVMGLQWRISGETRALSWSVGGSVIDKQADYGAAAVNASYYALNYAKQRANVALVWQITDAVALFLDSEYRKHASNPLRQSSAEAYFTSVSVDYIWSSRARVSVLIDNLTNDRFEYFPGSPGGARSASVRLTIDLDG